MARMGKPMKNRILGIVLALCLMAVAFAAVPTSAEIYYTGSVQTTDDTGDLQDAYYRGDRVYVAVEVYYMGELSAEDILVEMFDQSGNSVSSFYATADDPDVGTYESWAALPTHWLTTNGLDFAAGVAVGDVVVSAYDGWDYVEFDRTQVIVKDEGLTVSPDTWLFYPGETVTITLITAQTVDFYVEIVNYTYDDIENWTNEEAADGYWSTVWTIPTDTPDDDYMINVREESNHDVWYTYYMTIQMYELLVDANRYYVLPGETVDIYYEVVEVATMTSYDEVSLEWQAMWMNESGNDTYDSGTMPGSAGTWQFDVPTNIALYSWIQITFWANDTEDRVAESWVYMTIGQMAADMILDDGPYMPGETVSVEVYTSVFEESYGWIYEDSLPGATVEISVSFNDTEIDEYGAAGLVTDVSGTVSHDFDLADDAPQGAYIVTVTVSKLDYEVEMMAVFSVEYGGEMTVEFDKEYYYSGQIATFAFTAYWNNQEIAGESIFYMVYDDIGLVFTDNSTTGTGAYQINSTYVGGLWIEAVMNLDGYMLNGYAATDVEMADVVLTPSSSEYRPGDNVVFSYSIITEISSAELSFNIVDDMGVEALSGDLSFTPMGSFNLTIPAEPSESYTATITMNDNLGHIVSDEATTWLATYHEIDLWLISSSGFTSRAFEAGTTLTFGYSIDSYAGTDLEVYEIRVYNWNDDVTFRLLVTATDGEFEYTIPENALDGGYGVEVDLYDPIASDYLDYDYVSYTVMNDQSLWDKSVGGLDVFEVMTLLLLALIIVVLIVMPFVKGRMGAPKQPKAPEPAMPAPPPAEGNPPSG
jgi:hypothetical protein